MDEEEPPCPPPPARSQRDPAAGPSDRKELPPTGLSILPVAGLPEFAPGDNLAAEIGRCAHWLADGDVVVVTSKVVSKVEGALVRVPPDGDREAARQAAIDDQTVRVVARRGPLKIVQTFHGWVVAAAGIDASNVDQGSLVLLPEDADASARALRARLRELLGVDVAVVVSDTFGRTWREGLTDVAVGAAGIPALVDHRGAIDAHGNRLETTRIALVDELASAADLVKGKLDGVPVAVVRGLPVSPPDPDEGTRPLVRLPDEDLFPYGSRDVVASREVAADLVPRPGELAAVAAAFRTASAALPEFPVVLRYGGEGDGVVDVHLTDAVTTTTALNLGALLGAAVVQLHAEGWRTRWEPAPTAGGTSLVGRLWLGTSVTPAG
ncbi:coenzyme F420-0:L-glutamate ligase [Candidatus Blastococcus massiliensis]|uniref:coenzyme F420-0:L-glutamate ligase n=1 Tax=Candidatus Blastococcus massiliensis TaxID=1470358 RepID=UPI0004AEEC46|nr:coenzyme F420-0:L-glutamate ligase [Candidatus Blastococcus massiliensis]